MSTVAYEGIHTGDGNMPSEDFDFNFQDFPNVNHQPDIPATSQAELSQSPHLPTAYDNHSYQESFALYSSSGHRSRPSDYSQQIKPQTFQSSGSSFNMGVPSPINPQSPARPSITEAPSHQYPFNYGENSPVPIPDIYSLDNYTATNASRSQPPYPQQSARDPVNQQKKLPADNTTMGLFNYGPMTMFNYSSMTPNTAGYGASNSVDMAAIQQDSGVYNPAGIHIAGKRGLQMTPSYSDVYDPHAPAPGTGVLDGRTQFGPITEHHFQGELTQTLYEQSGQQSDTTSSASSSSGAPIHSHSIRRSAGLAASKSSSLPQVREGVPTTSTSSSGPLPASTPAVVKQDEFGVDWIEFEYSKYRVKTKFSIRCDIETVDVSKLADDFKKDNCIYPRATLPLEEYTGNRRKYEAECNTIGWCLSHLNPVLHGQRGLIQRAVDTWRNTNSNPAYRSRRVRRMHKKQR